MNTKLYTGDGNASKAITGVGFQPDWVWIKKRDGAASHIVSDSVRGVTKTLYTESTSAELTNNQYGWVSAFGTDGFTTTNTSPNAINGDGIAYVSWNWKAGTTSIPSSGQSLTPTGMSYNATSGISIIRYDSTDTNPSTIPHGLGVTPELVIFRNLDDTTNWMVYHKGLSSNKYLYLNSTDAESGSTDYIDVSSSLITLKTTWTAQNNGSNFICFAFAPVQGYSKFGSYTGNGNADGTFVYTGFKPSFFMCKKSSASGNNWTIWDNKRDPKNPMDLLLHPNTTSADNDSGDDIDFCSNGVKFRNSAGGCNASAATYIYMAFGQTMVGTNNVPATAR